MNKQEKIREGLRYFVQGDCAYYNEKECPFENNLACQECDERIHELLKYLHSEGVVIKVEEVSFYCPVPMKDIQLSGKTAYIETRALNEAGYGVFEPLIKEARDE